MLKTTAESSARHLVTDGHRIARAAHRQGSGPETKRSPTSASDAELDRKSGTVGTEFLDSQRRWIEPVILGLG